MFNIISHQGILIKTNHNEMSLHPSEWLKSKIVTTSNAGEDAENNNYTLGM